MKFLLMACLFFGSVFSAGECFAQSGGPVGGGWWDDENGWGPFNNGQITNYHSEHILICWRSIDDPVTGAKIGEQYGTLHPGYTTPEGVDWDFAAVLPLDDSTPLVWYKCGVGTAMNLRYEGIDVLYADVFWFLKVGTPILTGPYPDPTWLKTNRGSLPAGALNPVPDSYIPWY